MSRALKHHHYNRLKKNRAKYWGRDLTDTPRRHGMATNTPAVCSCEVCGHKRSWYGPTLQERRHALKGQDPE